MLEEYCKVDGEDIVIRMPVDAFLNGVLNSVAATHMYEWDGRFFKNNWTIVNKYQLAQDLLNELCLEFETGETILTLAFDDAFSRLVEYGSSDALLCEIIES